MQVKIDNSCFADTGETIEFLGVAAQCTACKLWTKASPSKTVATNVPSKAAARFSVSVPTPTGTDQFGRGGTCMASTCVYAVDDKFKSTTAVAAPVSADCVTDVADYCKMCSYESLPVRSSLDLLCKWEASGSFFPEASCTTENLYYTVSVVTQTCLQALVGYSFSLSTLPLP